MCALKWKQGREEEMPARKANDEVRRREGRIETLVVDAPLPMCPMCLDAKR